MEPSDTSPQSEEGEDKPLIRKKRPGILSVTIRDKAVLYATYMPFVLHGGLFVPTTKEFSLGEEIFMLLNLMEETEKLPVTGKVVWITPTASQGNRVAGVGIQLNEGEGAIIRNKIETYLAGGLKPDRSTHTM